MQFSWWWWIHAPSTPIRRWRDVCVSITLSISSRLRGVSEPISPSDQSKQKPSNKATKGNPAETQRARLGYKDSLLLRMSLPQIQTTNWIINFPSVPFPCTVPKYGGGKSLLLSWSCWIGTTKAHSRVKRDHISYLVHRHRLIYPGEHKSNNKIPRVRISNNIKGGGDDAAA